MAPTTYIKLDRGIIHWVWYTDPDTFRVFIHLLISANITDHLFSDITIKRGSLATSHASLADALGLTISKVRKAIRNLKETGEIETTRYANFQVIKIVKYDSYQSYSYNFPPDNRAKRQTFDRPLTDLQQTFDRPSTTIKEREKEIKKERNKESVCDIKKESSFSDTEKEDSQKKDNPHARKWGRFNNVILTDEEYTSLKGESENYEYYINKLSSHMKSTGRRYESHYATLCSWIMDDIRKGYKIPVQIVNGETKSKASYDIELAMKKAKTQVPEFKKRERR